jgi:heme-degrading monooxygenase HmoA
MPRLVPRAIRRSAAFAAACLLAAAACNPPAPTASTVPTETAALQATASPEASQASAAEIYARIRTQVEAIRGLQPTADVDPVAIDETQLRTNLEAEFDKENTADALQFSEETLITLGLLPPGSSLRKLTLDFQASQVAGYYSPDRKELFVVSRSGSLGPAEEVTYAHEFTHQLQDQTFDLSKLGLDSANQSDRALAQLALVEGDAVSVQSSWTTANLTPEELGELLTSSLDPEAIAALRNAPPYLRDTALFPYQDGFAFVSNRIRAGGYPAVDAVYAKLPESTEQVLHPDKYVAGEAPVAVKVPSGLAAQMGAGWKAAGEDTLGELILQLWLTGNGVTAATAREAAAGWAGDHLELLRGPNGATTVYLVTQWDSLVDAAEFSSAAKAAAVKLGAENQVVFDRRFPSVFVVIGTGAVTIAPRFFR